MEAGFAVHGGRGNHEGHEDGDAAALNVGRIFRCGEHAGSEDRACV
jgi:hypothetical protein